MHRDIFEADEVAVNGTVIASGESDPDTFETMSLTSPVHDGQPYPIGTLYLQSNGNTWRKRSSGWHLIEGNGIPINFVSKALQFKGL